MVREYPALVITDARDLSENSGNLAFAHPNLCPDVSVFSNMTAGKAYEDHIFIIVIEMLSNLI